MCKYTSGDNDLKGKLSAFLSDETVIITIVVLIVWSLHLDESAIAIILLALGIFLIICTRVLMMLMLMMMLTSILCIANEETHDKLRQAENGPVSAASSVSSSSSARGCLW